MSSKQGS